jgi:hypothetical protein
MPRLDERAQKLLQLLSMVGPANFAALFSRSCVYDPRLSPTVLQFSSLQDFASRRAEAQRAPDRHLKLNFD